MDKVYMINGHEVNFYCNEENRIVAASIESCKWDIDTSIWKNFGVHLDLYDTADRYTDRFEMPRAMKCVARCHPDDVFDEERGKRIAYKKLRKKYWAKYAKRMYNLGEIFVHASTFCYEDAQNAYNRADQIAL